LPLVYQEAKSYRYSTWMSDGYK